MKKLLILAALGLLAAAGTATAYEEAGCAAAVWSNEHGHYHCADGATIVRYAEPPAVVAAPRVSINLGYGYPAYPYYAPRFYPRPVFVFGAPHYRGHHWHHHHHGHWW